MALNKRGTITVNETVCNDSITIIQITEDRLKLILTRHISKLRKTQDWISSIALVVSLVGMLFTSTFESDTIKGVFITLAIASIGYLIYVIYNCVTNNENIDKIMEEIKDIDKHS